jgi:uncharacterized membrane protein YccC
MLMSSLWHHIEALAYWEQAEQEQARAARIKDKLRDLAERQVTSEENMLATRTQGGVGAKSHEARVLERLRDLLKASENRTEAIGNNQWYISKTIAASNLALMEQHKQIIALLTRISGILADEYPRAAHAVDRRSNVDSPIHPAWLEEGENGPGN